PASRAVRAYQAAEALASLVGLAAPLCGPRSPGPDIDAEAEPATAGAHAERDDGVRRAEVGAALAAQQHHGRRGELGVAGGAAAGDEVGHGGEDATRGARTA